MSDPTTRAHSEVAFPGSTGGRKPERWVRVTIEEAYIHCSKHIPLMKRMPKEIAWGTDDE